MRRFIAGAKCPDCGQLDTLFMASNEAGKRRECVRCGFADSLENIAPPAIPTRVEPAIKQEVSTEVVRLVDSGKR
ncbi:MAG TPA: YheV family putative zinc ribbon protein [Pseudomonadales bacterium]|jgi:hypothetical protein